MKYPLIIFVWFVLLSSCGENGPNKITNQPVTVDNVKDTLRNLERKWLEYEFNQDTAAIARFLDEDFISISGQDTSNKQNELAGVYQRMSTMHRDSIFVDSFKIEEPFIVQHFDNTAIAIFNGHMYKTAKGKHQEKRTRFCDVWRNVDGEWKAISSMATTIEEIK